ncbi:MAG: SRPBCC domain-containing protein [Silicimonas sp.]|nr:SRPBCC domain-containing protein [Silicimonas sp.]
MAELEKSLWIDAPPRLVFTYFTQSEKMSQWAGIEAVLDPVPGGIYRLDMGKAGVITGRFDAVSDTRIVQIIDAPGGGTGSRIEITLAGEVGGCRVTIRHSGLPLPFDRLAARGWDHHLARLSVVATGGTVPPDPLCRKPMSALME